MSKIIKSRKKSKRKIKRQKKKNKRHLLSVIHGSWLKIPAACSEWSRLWFRDGLLIVFKTLHQSANERF